MTPLLLLPGMMCDERLFHPLTTALGANYPCVTADLTTHDDWSALAAAVLRKAPPRFDLLGVSMGGALALELCALCPERVARLIVLDANPHADTEERAQGRLALLKHLDRHGLHALMWEKLLPNYLAANHPAAGEADKDSAVLSLCWQMADHLGEAVYHRQTKALLSRSSRLSDLANFQAPTLILRGDGDRVCPASYHRALADALPNADYVEIANAGHLPTLEAPAATSEIIQKWLLA